MDRGELNQISIAPTLFRLIWQQTEFHLVQDQSENCNPNPSFCLIQQNLEMFSPSVTKIAACTQRNISEILLNQTEIRLFLPFSD